MDRNIFHGVISPLLVEETLPVIIWMKDKELIPPERKCSACLFDMGWRKYHSNDGDAWICRNKECSSYKNTVSIRKDSIFENSKIKLQIWLHLIHCWCIGLTEKATTELTNVSRRSVQEVYGAFRMACSRHFANNPIKLGGPGKIVQIDESCFSSKPKYNRGRSKPQLWVFGLVDTSTTPGVGYMEIVERRDEATLLPIIRKVTRSGTTIHSDEWKAYINIASKLEFHHQTVNHTLHFVDPETHVHTQNIESYWNKHKHNIKMMHGC